MDLKKRKIIWLILLSIAFSLRFYNLGSFPSGLYVDEASIGYNAYSILHTGADEFGKKIPIVFRSFNDFKTPLYIYFSVPFIKLFDLSMFSVRLLSAISSFLTIPLIYLLINKIINYKMPKTHYKSNYNIVPLLVAFIMAISPWHILFGRAAFEVNLSHFLFLLSTYLFYLSFNKPRILILSAIFFALTIVSYHSQRLIVPLFLIILFIKYYKLLLSNSFKSSFIISILIGLLLLLPTIYISLSPGFLARAGGINIFNLQNHTPAGYLEMPISSTLSFVNSRIYLSLKESLSLYSAYFSPRNLFFMGDPDTRVSFPGLSTFYVWMTPFYLIGLYALFRKYRKSELGFFTISTLILFPFPAALTNDPFTTIRSFPLVAPIAIVISLGIFYTYSIFKTKIDKRFINTSISLISLFVVTYSLLKLYSSFLLFEFHRSREWNYGFKALVQTIASLETKLPIVIDNARVEPYSEILFFSKFDPESYQKQNFEVSLDNYYDDLTRNKHKSIGKIETRSIDWEKDTKIQKYLIGDDLAISEDQIVKNNLTLVKNVIYPDGSVAFRIVKTNIN